MPTTKKQVTEWIKELGVDPTFHGVSMDELIELARNDSDPHGYLEDLAAAQSLDPEDEDQADGDDPATSSAGGESGDEPEDGDEPDDVGEPGPEYARQGSAHRPKCPIHNELMTARSTQGPLTYYKCPIAGCNHSESVPRVNMQRFMQQQGERRARQPNVDPRK